MTDLTGSLNFWNTVEREDTITIDPKKDINYYETLCQYCADHTINLDQIDDVEFDICVETMRDYSEAFSDKPYFFSVRY